MSSPIPVKNTFLVDEYAKNQGQVHPKPKNMARSLRDKKVCEIGHRNAKLVFSHNAFILKLKNEILRQINY